MAYKRQHEQGKMRIGLLISCALTGVMAFGRTGHYVLGTSISRLVFNDTLNWVAEKSFFSHVNNSWGLASLEADGFKSRPALRWTARLHFISVDDDPPTNCPGVQRWNETKGWNILKGIQRFTDLLISKNGSSFSALLVLHLLQDLHLPTHVCGKARGGNDVTVEYNGHRVNLHRLWDSVLVQELADRAGGTDALIEVIVKAARPRSLRECATHDSWPESWMDDVVAKANSTHMLNCKVVWRDDLRKPEILLPVMHGLLVEATVFSTCHWDRLAAVASASEKQDEDHAEKPHFVVQP